MLRSAEPADFDALEELEARADSLLVDLFQAADWPAVTSAAERRAMPGYTLVLESPDGPPMGFVQVLEVDDGAHLEQVSVDPRVGRRGHGRMLVMAALDEARRRGHRAVTLRTYRDVPWNAPFYATCGFRVSTPATAFQRSLVSVEERIGLGRFGERVQMTAAL